MTPIDTNRHQSHTSNLYHATSLQQSSQLPIRLVLLLRLVLLGCDYLIQNMGPEIGQLLDSYWSPAPTLRHYQDSFEFPAHEEMLNYTYSATTPAHIERPPTTEDALQQSHASDNQFDGKVSTIVYGLPLDYAISLSPSMHLPVSILPLIGCCYLSTSPNTIS